MGPSGVQFSIVVVRRKTVPSRLALAIYLFNDRSIVLVKNDHHIETGRRYI